FPTRRSSDLGSRLAEANFQREESIAAHTGAQEGAILATGLFSDFAWCDHIRCGHSERRKAVRSGAGISFTLFLQLLDAHGVDLRMVTLAVVPDKVAGADIWLDDMDARHGSDHQKLQI